MAFKYFCLAFLLQNALLVHVIYGASLFQEGTADRGFNGYPENYDSRRFERYPDEHANRRFERRPEDPASLMFKRYSSLPIGHPDRCEYELTGNMSGSFPRLGILPGFGWDNLQNEELNNVMKHEYKRCKTTADGRILIPDGVTVIAIKDSEIQTTAEVFQHWDDYTSTTSSSINSLSMAGDGEMSKSLFGPISGRFSTEYKNAKSSQYSSLSGNSLSKSAIVRMQLRYLRYKAQIETGSHLDQEFKARLRKIAAHILEKRNRLARYESQLLVRDYGSHVINGIILGAALVKTDVLQTSASSESHETGQQSMSSEAYSEMKASAKIGFFKMAASTSVNMYDASSSESSSSSNSDSSSVTTSSSTISAFGGSVVNPTSFSASEWVNSIDDNLVALDKTGEPLHYFVNYNTLRDLPDFIVQSVHREVKHAVQQYYLHNTYNGCTKPGDPNFSFQANHDDGTCKGPEIDSKFGFGGVFQECTNEGPSDLCTDITVKNPITDDFSCPQNYQKVLLNNGVKSQTDSQQITYNCWFIHWFKCHKTVYVQSTAHYSAYWCARAGNDDQTAMLFGGVYTPKVPNILTRSSSCPNQFVGLTILDDLTVCVSDVVEAGSLYLPFAGFQSCSSGNPLALGSMSKFQSSKSPKNCPRGYSTKLAVVDDECEINYCIKTFVIKELTLPSVMKPPYISMPLDHPTDKSNDSSPVFVVNENGSEWVTLREAEFNAMQIQAAILTNQSTNAASLKDIKYQLMKEASPIAQLMLKGIDSKQVAFTEESKASPMLTLHDLKPNSVPQTQLSNSNSSSSVALLMGIAATNENQAEETSPDDKNTGPTENNQTSNDLSVGLIVLCSVVGTLLFTLVTLLIGMLVKRRTIYRPTYQKI